MRKPISRRRKYIYGVVLCLVILRIALSFVYANCDSDWQLKIYSFLQDNYLSRFDILLYVLGVIAFLNFLFEYIFKLSVLFVIIFVIVLGIIASVVLSSLNNTRVKSIDARRVSDLRQIQLALELWWDANGQKYPDKLSVLETQFISQVPFDPNPQQTYEYRLSDDKQSYILKAVLGTSAGESLPSCISRYRARGVGGKVYVPGGDIDGTIFGLDCNDPAYCVSNLTQDQINKLQNNN